ncbi:MAG: sigma-70 family RNA polymerase sigma factor [Sedimentisphaerales bacterium]|nr:sigma-70 family RNA polymerase sigma factor [Sedimentisphaerales bacterium]
MSQLEPQTDEQLLSDYRKGNEQAFMALTRRYERELYNFLLRFLGKSAQAEDVFQETFLQVHLSVDSFDASRRFRPWLYTIAANKARDLLRKQSRHGTVQVTGVEEGDEASFWDMMLQDSTTPDAILDQKQQTQAVRQIVAQMPEHLREILLLAYYNQMAYKDMAEALKIPLGTVKSRLHSAVAAFGRLWHEREKETEA